jgi:hypothetical protein
MASKAMNSRTSRQRCLTGKLGRIGMDRRTQVLTRVYCLYFQMVAILETGAGTLRSQFERNCTSGRYALSARNASDGNAPC